MIIESFHTIDRQNTLSWSSEDDKAKMMLKMFLTLSSINENSVGNEINKYFIKVIPENSSDLLTILSALSKKIPKEMQPKKEGVYIIIHNIISKTFCRNNILVFSKYNISDIGKILAFVFLQDLKSLKIKTYDALQEKINLFLEGSKNIITEYELFRRNMPFNPKAKTNVYEMFKELKLSKKELDIPIELAFIVQKMSMITKLTLQFETITEPLFNLALILLLNYKLLFPNITVVELNMCNNSLVKEIFKRHQNQLAKNTEEQMKQINLDSEEYLRQNYTLQSTHVDIQEEAHKSNNSYIRPNGYESTSDFSDTEEKAENKNNVTILSKVEEKLVNYMDILTEQKKLFELGVIFPYFISHWNDLRSINIISPYNFGREIEDALSLNYKVILVNYHYLNFLYLVRNLRQFTFEFNSLDYDSFEKLLSFLNFNNKIESLTLSFFGIELYYLPSSLFQLINKLKININHLLNQGTDTALKNYDTEEFSQLLIEYLINQFEENCEKFFWMIKGEGHIANINLFFVTPQIISAHEGYSMIITKLILNFLLLLGSPKAKFESMKIIAPYVHLNSKKMPEMTEIVDRLDSNRNRLKSFSIQIQFSNMKSLGNLLGDDLIELNIGDLDLDSFNSFIDQISSAEYTVKSKLKKVNIALMRKITQLSPIKSRLMKYLTIWIKSLTEIGLSTNLLISSDQFAPFYQEINYNSVQQYCFAFNKTCQMMHMQTPQLFYYEYYVQKSKVAYVLNQITLKYVTSRHDKVYHKLLSFLIPGKGKELIVTFK